MSEKQYRVENDSMGEIKVPADKHWGAQTQRAIENFNISGITMPPEFLQALGLLKWACLLYIRRVSCRCVSDRFCNQHQYEYQ